VSQFKGRKKIYGDDVYNLKIYYLPKYYNRFGSNTLHASTDFSHLAYKLHHNLFLNIILYLAERTDLNLQRLLL